MEWMGGNKTTSQQTLIATNDNDFTIVLLLNPCVIRCLDPTDWYDYGFRFVFSFFSIFHFITIWKWCERHQNVVWSCFNIFIYCKMLEQMSSRLSWNQELWALEPYNNTSFSGWNLWVSCGSSICEFLLSLNNKELQMCLSWKAFLCG